MNYEQLKQSILQKAISGRLVEQDFNDEPASELLKRIKKEKQQLIKSGKIKKEKKLAPISPDEIPFDIPPSWQWVRLGEICNLYTGNSINATEKASKYTNVKGIDYIGTKDVSFSNQITYNNGVNIPDSDISLFRIAKAGKILMCIEGGSAGRKIAILDKDVCFGNKLCCFNTYNYSIDKYLYYFLQSKGFTNNFQENKQGIIGGVSINILKTLLFPLPPLEEQERIVKKIEQIMPLVKEYGQTQEQLDNLNKTLPIKLKQSILQKAISGRLVEQDSNDEPASELLKRIKKEKQQLIKSGKIKKEKPLAPISLDEIPFDIPPSWQWVRLGEIVSINMGQSPVGESLNTSQNGIEFHQGKILFTEKYIKTSQIYTNKPTKLADANSLLLCVRAPVGIVNITLRKICIGRGLCSIKPYGNMPLLFFFYCLQTIKRDFEDKATGSTFTAISHSTIYNELFPLPPLEEQERIVKKIEQIMPLVKELEG